MPETNRPSGSPRPTQRPAGKRFRGAPAPAAGAASRPASRPATAPARRPAAGRAGASTAPRRRPASPAYTGGRSARPAGPRPLAVGIALLAAVAAIALVAVFAFPMVGRLISGETAPTVEAGQEVHVTIPEGADGDTIASALAEAHVIDNPKDYYAAVKKLEADMLLKPGSYILKTGQDPVSVVEQLIAGPNAGDSELTIPEGLTVAQVASQVEKAFGISADDFTAQAKASTYEADYPFLKGAYNDSLEGYLYPKTYTFTEKPTADSVIRRMLDQFVTETKGLDLESADGLSAAQVISMASLIERESAVADERPTIASVIYNRLAKDMPLQIDAAIVYARGGGSQEVSYADLEIDSPYNVYKHTGLTPGPICSPSVSSIEAALKPASTDYLYYVASAKLDGSHSFTASDAEFEKLKNAYYKALENS